MKITILTPVYNDWKSASKLIEEINTIVKDIDAEFSLIIVNDASTEEKPTSISNTENLLSVEILNIKNNQGHGRCIATGLKHIFKNKEWKEFYDINWDDLFISMRKPSWIFDTRKCINYKNAKKAGFNIWEIGNSPLINK